MDLFKLFKMELTTLWLNTGAVDWRLQMDVTVDSSGVIFE